MKQDEEGDDAVDGAVYDKDGKVEITQQKNSLMQLNNKMRYQPLDRIKFM